MTVFTDAIAAGQAELTRLMPAPVEPFGYGVDLSCVSDLTDSLAEVNAFAPLGIAEALIRRLTCPRGGLPDDPDYGYDLVALLNRGASDANLLEYGALIRGECRKDDRVDDVLPTLTMESITRTLFVRLQVKAVDPALRVFEFTLAVTDAGVLLASIG